MGVHKRRSWLFMPRKARLQSFMALCVQMQNQINKRLEIDVLILPMRGKKKHKRKFTTSNV